MSNHLKLLRSRAVVVSVEEKAGKTCQVRNTETNESEPTDEASKADIRCQNRGLAFGPGQAWQEPDDGPSGIRRRGGVTVFQAQIWNVGTCCLDAKGANRAGNTGKVVSTEARRRGGVVRSSAEAAVMAVERRGHVIGPWSLRQLHCRRSQ